MFSPLTERLIEALRGLPSIGPRSAQRLAFQLLAPTGKHKGLALADALQQALQRINHCHTCRMYTENAQCDICAHPKRNRSILCIVESPAELAAIEATNSYHGLYFVLHGHLSPLDGIGPSDIGIPALLQQLTKEAITEVIIATNATMEGKATAHYIATHMDQTRIQCTRIAHGVPLGGELEYLDRETLMHALDSRVPIQG